MQCKEAHTLLIFCEKCCVIKPTGYIENYGNNKDWTAQELVLLIGKKIGVYKRRLNILACKQLDFTQIINCFRY